MDLTRFRRTMRLYWICALYLILFSLCLSAYRRLLLGYTAVGFEQSIYLVVQSLVLAKIIVIGQELRLGKRFEHMPLAIPTLYKTIVFTLFALIFHFLEHVISLGIHGKSLYRFFLEINWPQEISRLAIQFFAFILLFAFLELGRIVGGEDRLFDLFFKRR